MAARGSVGGQLVGFDRPDRDVSPARPVGPLPVQSTPGTPQGFPDRAAAARTLAPGERSALIAAVAQTTAR